MRKGERVLDFFGRIYAAYQAELAKGLEEEEDLIYEALIKAAKLGKIKFQIEGQV
jgi:hypothetical protein